MIPESAVGAGAEKEYDFVLVSERKIASEWILLYVTAASLALWMMG